MRKIVIIIAFLSFIMTLDSDAINGYEWQFLLPLTFLFLYIFFAPPLKNMGIGYSVLNIVWLIRYCLSPVLNKVSDYQIIHYSIVDENDLYIAQVLMLIELLVTIFVCSYFYRRGHQTRKFNVSLFDKNNKGAIDTTRAPRTVGMTILISMLALSLLVLVFDSNALNGFNFIFNSNYEVHGSANFGLSILILWWTKIIITVFLISKFGAREYRKHNSLNILSSIVIVLLSISFFNGMSRNEVLIESLAYIYLLTRLFPKNKKGILAICISSLGAILLFITISRYFDTRNVSEGLANYDLNNIVVTLNSYFAGQQNVAIGVRTLDLYWHEYTMLTIFKDIFVNAMFLNIFVPDVPSTVDMFNRTLYGHSQWADQISPMITQVIGLFNVFGIFIPAFIVFLIIKMDRIANDTPSIFAVFLVSFISVNLAFYSPGNLTILSTAIFNRFLPLYIIYRLTNVYMLKNQ
ncbi:hypothetical protein [Falsibacillus pallidus]|uniref:hypothetical protein n=1 Tax=Falsibacillus pallidus TaxID=493781 RepID=UPI003D954DC6